MKIHIPESLRNLLRLKTLTPDLFPTVQRTIVTIGQEIEGQWKAWASGAKMPSGDRLLARTGKYAASIKSQPVDGGMGVEVSSDSPIHKYLDDGTREFDLKTLLGRSAHAKMSKSGSRYMVVPFRHDVQKAGDKAGFGPRGESRVTPQIARFFKRAEEGTGRARILGKYKERSQQLDFRGRLVTRTHSRFGARLPARIAGHDPSTGQPVIFGQRSKQNSQGQYTWKTGSQAGMVHLSGFEGRHGSYLTFRTISEKSPAASWISPGIRPRRIMQQLRTWTFQHTHFVQRLQAAVREDIEDLIRG